MQRKKYIAPSDLGELLFHREFLEFTQKWARHWPEKPVINHRDALRLVSKIAVDPEWTAKYYDADVTCQVVRLPTPPIPYAEMSKETFIARQKQPETILLDNQNHRFVELYRCYPDFFPAALVFLRDKWNTLDNSASGKLKKFLALKVIVNPSYHGRKPQRRLHWDPLNGALTDKELAMAFENDSYGDDRLKLVRRHWPKKGPPESGKLVRDARRFVVERMRAVEILEKEYFDAKGILKSDKIVGR